MDGRADVIENCLSPERIDLYVAGWTTMTVDGRRDEWRPFADL